jgi:protocatechuate 3,4-dioxygenase beta subunit
MNNVPAATETWGLAASQTIGPFFQIGFEDLYQTDLTVPGLNGIIITISGKILDADRLAVPDALVEIWQANSFGKYAHSDDHQDKPLDPGFTGFGRCPRIQKERSNSAPSSPAQYHHRPALRRRRTSMFQYL